MLTNVENWQIVEIYEAKVTVGYLLWGIIVDDETCRFLAGDYVCTSQITKILKYSEAG